MQGVQRFIWKYPICGGSHGAWFTPQAPGLPAAVCQTPSGGVPAEAKDYSP